MNMNIDELERRIQSDHKLILVETHEEARFLLEVYERFKSGSVIRTWSPTSYLVEVQKPRDFFKGGSASGDPPGIGEVITDPFNAVTWILDQSLAQSGDVRVTEHLFIYLMRRLNIGKNDVGTYVANALKDRLSETRKVCIIVVTNHADVSPVLERDHFTMTYSLKNQGEHTEFVKELTNAWRTTVNNPESAGKLVYLDGEMVAAEDAYNLEYTDEEFATIGSALSGLTEDEALRAYNYSLKTTGRASAPLLANMKKGIIEQAGLLQWHEPRDMSEVGGLGLLKEWLRKRGAAMASQKAREYGLPPPKGIILLGPPGAGKSLISKAVAKLWGLPLIRLDVGVLLNKWVGESESNTRRVLGIMEAAAPIVVWIDEIDKALGGVQSSNYTDSGVLSRVFGTLLTWAQDRENPVFIVATCNAMLGPSGQLLMPPEMQRRGRFDALFYVDLPTYSERLEIARIHIEKAREENSGRSADDFDLESIASRKYRGEYIYTGAEIEFSVIEAMSDAFARDEEYNTEDILNALDRCIPISYTMKDTIKALRKFGRDRCTPASLPEDVVRSEEVSTAMNDEFASNISRKVDL